MLKFSQILEIYYLISLPEKNKESRKDSLALRRAALSNLNGMVKVAFDTRRIDQEEQFNPRRNLQYYHRGEQFISEATAGKVKNLGKLKTVLEDLKSEFGKEPEWQDSYCRILLNTINSAIREEDKDGDFSDNQPSVGSIDYIQELLYVRYRLDINEIGKISEKDIKKMILDKDEELIRKEVKNIHQISKKDVASQSYDSLVDKLFGDVKATAENPEVERTVTITIKDKFIKE